MLQTIDGREVFVVDFDTMPELPITWSNEEEEPYARCLTAAIEDEVITKPGKYGIHVKQDAIGSIYHIFQIVE